MSPWAWGAIGLGVLWLVGRKTLATDGMEPTSGPTPQGSSGSGKDSTMDDFKGAVSGGVSGASTGAAIGSAIPVIGTTAGGIIGGVIGGGEDTLDLIGDAGSAIADWIGW